MKKIFISTFLFIFLGVNFIFAKSYDIKDINNARLVTSYSTDTTIDQIDTVTFGSYPQSDVTGSIKEPIEWVVLKKDENNATLLSKIIIDSIAYNDKDEERNYDGCYIRRWLLDNFYNTAFNNVEMAALKECYKADKVSLLSKDDVLKYRFVETNANGLGDYPTYNIGKTMISNYADGKWQPGPNHDQWALRARVIKTNLTFQGETVWHKDTMFKLDLKASNYICTSVTGLTGVRPMICVDLNYITSLNSNSSQINNGVYVDNNVTAGSGAKSNVGNNGSAGQNNNSDGGVIAGLPSRESELRSDDHFYLDNSMQRSTWVYYVTYYYHVDGNGNIEKSKWITSASVNSNGDTVTAKRYVGVDGRMYRGRQTPDGKWVGDDGLVVDIHQDLYNSTLVDAAEPDSWYKTKSGLWYYFENDRTTTKKGWFTDARDNQTYYLDPTTGIMAVGWTTIGGSKYYFNESHKNEKNWYATGGGFYDSYGKKVKAYGSMFKNEQTPDGHTVDANGRLIN